MVEFDLLNDVVSEEDRVRYEAEGKECISVAQVKSFLNANKNDDVQFNISSLGGDLGAAITISGLIKAFPKKTIGNIIGLTASAGTVIADSCDETIMSDNTLFLAHNGWKEVTGNIYDFQKAVTDMAKSDAIMIKIYREKTGLPDSKIIDIMKASDWLTPSEARNYGFVDRVYPGTKIAASALMSAAHGKLNSQLLIKLKEKMNLFGKEKAKKTAVYALTMKDGKQCLIDAAEPATGVSIMPVGAASELEDGTFELTDGRVITVSGGTITAVETPSEPSGGEMGANAAEIIAAVSALVVSETAKIKAEVMAELGKIKSAHVPPKGTAITPGQAKAVTPDEVQGKVKAITDGIFAEIQKSRKA